MYAFWEFYRDMITLGGQVACPPEIFFWKLQAVIVIVWLQ